MATGRIAAAEILLPEKEAVPAAAVVSKLPEAAAVVSKLPAAAVSKLPAAATVSKLPAAAVVSRAVPAAVRGGQGDEAEKDFASQCGIDFGALPDFHSRNIDGYDAGTFPKRHIRRGGTC